MINESNNFIQFNYPDGALKHTQQGKDFLQSDEWRKFQESVGRKTFNISLEGFWANIIEHSLPIVGKYFYVPRGPVTQSSAFPSPDKSGDSSKPSFFQELINLAKENKIGWIRIEPSNSFILDSIRSYWRVTKAPHDMQPKEVLMLDITKPEEELLAGMKQKTRYNIRLAEKKNVKVISHQSPDIDKKYIEEFIKLVKITAKRDKITPHPENYYRKMFEIIPGDILKLYVAEYQNKIIAANLMVFYGKIATYLHGASDNEHRNLMAPYLLQWQAIKDAKSAGCEKYDFGGIRTKTGEGITKFKLGFAPNIKPVEFPGSYDIILNPLMYKLYRIMQKIKGLV